MPASELSGYLIEGAVALAWFGLTAAAYRKWGNRGLLGVPIGAVVVVAIWAVAVNVACFQGAGCL
jgi:hypothetical protein